jgi:hypothetical protein
VMISRYVGSPAKPNLADAKQLLKAMPLPSQLTSAEDGHDPTESPDRV